MLLTPRLQPPGPILVHQTRILPPLPPHLSVYPKVDAPLHHAAGIEGGGGGACTVACTPQSPVGPVPMQYVSWQWPLPLPHCRSTPRPISRFALNTPMSTPLASPPAARSSPVRGGLDVPAPVGQLVLVVVAHVAHPRLRCPLLRAPRVGGGDRAAAAARRQLLQIRALPGVHYPAGAFFECP